MFVYFVRHGETAYNRKRVHQDGTVPLSDRGREQVLKAADALKQFPITKVITSDYARARESADAVGRTLGLLPEENPLFREVLRPSVLFHTPHYSFLTARVGLAMMRNIRNPDWHYDDEENLHDLKRRVAAAVNYLKSLESEHEHVAVVSHAFIISLFIKYMCAHKDVRVRDYLKTLFAAKKIANASISTLAWNDDNNPNTCDWICLDLDNVEHLK